MKKKRKKKKTALKMQSPASREVTLQEAATISNHEDTALKVTAQYFQEEIMPALNIEGRVVGILPTEGIHLELKKGFEDFNFLMSDDSIKHFEFQSTNEGKIGLKRFRVYESQMSYQQERAVTTYVLFSGAIKNPMTEFTEGINTYRIEPIIMQDKDADEVIAQLQRKVDSEEEITKADLLPLVLSPIMGGKMSQKERVSAAYDITRKATGVDAEVIRKVEAVIYIMADKFLDSAEMEQLKKEIKMTRLGKMLYDDGKEAKLKELVGKKLEKGYSVSEIADMLEEEEAVIGAIIKEL
ncbi:MAG: hypothetical protein IJ439_06860 [Tyzzerella sp.]|nr:hypothetical protein [Tyzzerella sp.]